MSAGARFLSVSTRHNRPNRRNGATCHSERITIPAPSKVYPAQSRRSWYLGCCTLTNPSVSLSGARYRVQRHSLAFLCTMTTGPSWQNGERTTFNFLLPKFPYAVKLINWAFFRRSLGFESNFPKLFNERKNDAAGIVRDDKTCV